MVSLSGWFKDLLFGSGMEYRAIAAIGSGGKTSLIWHLAASLSAGRSILVTPSTKMFLPEGKPYNRYYDKKIPVPAPGITLAGIFNKASGKLESFPPFELEHIIPDYDLSLIEADGSRGLPLKAWNDNEPVIPQCTGLTVGMLPLWPLGKPLTEKIVHRMELFISLTGASAGKPLAMEHLVSLIAGRTAKAGTTAPHGRTSPPGLFDKACGRKLLFFNQIENDESLAMARELACLLPAETRTGLCAIIAGSVRENILEVLHQGF